MDTDKITIEHIPAKALFRTVVDGVEAHVAYKSDGKSLDIRHTIVPEPIGGRGIASALVRAAYDYALANNLTPVATCSYAVIWLQRHPEYHGETGKDNAGPNSCAL